MRRLSILLVALALVAVACSSEPSVIATVGGTEITEDDLAALFESDVLPVDESLRQTIFALVAREVFMQQLTEDYGVAVDELAVEELFVSLMADIEAAGSTPADALGIPNAGPGMIRFNAEMGVIREQVIEGRIAEPETIEAFFSDPLAYTTVCVRHILVETEEEAVAVADRLADGEDFTAVAGEVSLDTATLGGDLGCSPANRYVPEFAQASVDAALGEVHGPVETQFGFHILIVDDRIAPTEEELLADPLTHLTDQEASILWQEWFNDQLQEAEVSLDERYGAWTPVGILPPGQTDLAPDEEG